MNTSRKHIKRGVDNKQQPEYVQSRTKSAIESTKSD
jgi:hypothetical protein